MPDIRDLQAFLRTSAQAGRTVLRVPPFTVTIHPTDPMRFVNYAVPDDGAEPDTAAVEALRAAFRERDRLPRLEWLEEAAPAVVPVLAEAGMTQELRTRSWRVRRMISSTPARRSRASPSPTSETPTCARR
jgi:hypothetical protein